MAWTTQDINGKHADVYVPEKAESEPYVILHLHGHSEQTLKDNPTFTTVLEQRGLRCICPHGRRSWWLDQLCTEYDPEVSPQSYLLENLIPWIEQTWKISPPAIGLTGISMGGQGAYNWPIEMLGCSQLSRH